MGHPPGAVWLPTDHYRWLAPVVQRIAAAHGGSPDELAAALRTNDGSPIGQLAALAWVLDTSATRVLLVRHRVLGWSCPGGHLERSEEPAAAARRELAEETGLALAPVTPDPVTLSVDEMPADDDGPAHRHWTLGYRFVGDPAQGLSPEGDPVAWHPVDDLPADAVADLAPLLASLTQAR